MISDMAKHSVSQINYSENATHPIQFHFKRLCNKVVNMYEGGYIGSFLILDFSNYVYIPHTRDEECTAKFKVHCNS